MNQTTGQRIAQRRKMLGMSQESLGQHLGVSRQAISKWESDTTTPEIGKLIAMSHLFSVSVGWLLCEEEEPTPEQTEAFTENQLRLLEKVLTQKPAIPRWQKIAVGAALCVTLLCGVASLMLSIQAVRRAENANDTYRDQIDWLFDNYGSAQSQLDGISAQLRDLQETDDLFSEYDMTARAWPEWKGASLTFTAMPKTWNESDKGALVVLREGTEVTRAEAVWDGFRVTATVELEKANDYEYHFLYTTADGAQVQEKLHLPGYAHLIGMLSFGADGRAKEWELRDGVFRITDYSFQITYPQIPPRADTARWDQMDLVLYVNDQEVSRSAVTELLKGHNEVLTEAVSTGDEDYWIALQPELNIHKGVLEFPLPRPETDDRVSLWVEAVFRAGEQTTPFRAELQVWPSKMLN